MKAIRSGWYWTLIPVIVGIWLGAGAFLIGLQYFLEDHEPRDWWFMFAYLAIGLVFAAIQARVPKDYRKYHGG